MQRSFLVALGAALVAAFALGGSFVPIGIAGNLLVVYGLFLAIFGVALAAMLVTQFGGEFGDALAVVRVGSATHRRSRRERGAGRIPIGPGRRRPGSPRIRTRRRCRPSGCRRS